MHAPVRLCVVTKDLNPFFLITQNYSPNSNSQLAIFPNMVMIVWDNRMSLNNTYNKCSNSPQITSSM